MNSISTRGIPMASQSVAEATPAPAQSSTHQLQISLMGSERRHQMELEFNSLHMCMKMSSPNGGATGTTDLFVAKLRSKFECECSTLEQQIQSELNASQRRAQHDHDAFCQELVKTFEMRLNLICQNYKRYIEVKKVQKPIIIKNIKLNFDRVSKVARSTK